MFEVSVILGAISGGIAGWVGYTGKTFFAIMVVLILAYAAGFLAGYDFVGVY